MNPSQKTIQFASSKRDQKKRYHWFSQRGCVEYEGDTRRVFISGTLIAKFDKNEVYVRNIVLLGLDQDPTLRKGKLVQAYGLAYESLRRIRQLVAKGGLAALPARGPGGNVESKIDVKKKRQIHRLFSEGIKAVEAYRRIGQRIGVTYQTIWRVRKQWEEEQSKKETDKTQEVENKEEIVEQGELKIEEGLDRKESESGQVRQNLPLKRQEIDEIEPDTFRGGQRVQHAGGLLLVALVHGLGLYDATMMGWKTTQRWRERLRVAIDAVVLALGIGQKCVEGIRRLSTKTAEILLRTKQVPSESWVRRIIKHYLEKEDSAKMHLGMLGVYLEESRNGLEKPAVFYTQGHKFRNR